MDTISVGTQPIGVSVSPDGSKLYVTNFNDASVSVINTATNTVSATITVGSFPDGISVSPDGSKVYVANYRSNTVSVINSSTNTVSSAISVGSAPVAIGNFISPITVGIAPQSMLSTVIEAYPNPANDKLTVKSLQKSTIVVINIQGQTILQQTAQQGKTDIDISGLAKGVYILRLCSNDKTAVARIVKE